jgi:nucleotidyltransferase/DNA polymerase involved in DNA repair
LESAVKEIFMATKTTTLSDLISVGPAMLRDFELLGIRSVEQLAKANPVKMYHKLGRVARRYQDICVLDVFRAAVAQARDPQLPAEQCQWWYWSKKRKESAETQTGPKRRAER